MQLSDKIKTFFSREKRTSLTWYWLAINLSYDIIRAIVVNLVFSSHNVSGLTYLLFALVFSAIFSFSSVRLVYATLEKRTWKIVLYSTISLLSFFAPDAYIFVKGRNVPTGTYVILIVYLCIGTYITVKSLVKDASAKKHK